MCENAMYRIRELLYPDKRRECAGGSAFHDEKGGADCETHGKATGVLPDEHAAADKRRACSWRGDVYKRQGV